MPSRSPSSTKTSLDRLGLAAAAEVQAERRAAWGIAQLPRDMILNALGDGRILTQKELAERVPYANTTVSRVLASMVEAGELECQRAVVDARHTRMYRRKS